MTGRPDQGDGADTSPPTRVTTPNEGVPHAGWDESAPIAAPLRLHETTVSPAWCDYNGHMSESSYLLVVGDNADAFFRYFGVDEAYRASGGSLYTAETHLHHKGEAREGDRLTFTLQVLGVDDKRIHLVHEVHDETSDVLVATAEQMLLHVDMTAGKVSPLPEHLKARLDAIADAHGSMPVPDYVGHVMGLPER
ncbi:MAG: thioesterase family protein [Actinomycetota bacterium]|nr:thioesterase family protein [Actinomycetota bacterium]MDH4352616.1 thioesterase family protein [Actinomycetota bacterium]